MASISKIKIGTEIRDIHAVQLTNERKITLSGSVTGTGYFDGSGDLTITTSTNHTHNYAGSSSAGGGAKKNESYQVGSITTTYGNQWNIINQWITNDRLKIQVLNDGAVQSSYPIEVNHAYKLVDPSADYNKTTALLSKGSATQPVYFSEGVPVACTYSVNATVPANAKFTDTVYTHPTTSGNKHIPAGGSSGQILRWSADGTAVWGNDNNTTYSVATESANGLLSKEDKIKLNNTNVAYGTCATAADVAEKTVALSGNTQWALKNGSIIMVKFNITNTASNVTLNVNNTGAYPIWYSNAEYTSTGSAYTGYANRTITYMFNGTHWVWISGSYDANTQSNTNSTNTNSKIFIIGATSQGSNKTTYSHDTAYVGTDGCLYSNSTKVSVEGHTHNYAGSSSAGGAANSVKTNLIIKLNGGSTEGTNLFTFNGSTAKTINITPSAIGAAAASHGTHVSYGTTASAVNTTASAGTATTVSRSDHVHSLDKATVVAALGYTPPTIDTTYGSMSSSEGITGTATTNRVLTAANLKAIIGGSTAGAVAWDNITGKPTSFAPSTHDHDSTYVNVTGDTMTGNLFIKSGNPYLGFKNASGETTGYVQYVESTDSYGIGAGIAKSLVVTNSGSISIPANQTFTPRTTNTGSIGTSNVKWNAMYATTFYGALSGNASSASKVNNSLTIKLNGGTTEGTNLFTFNGSAAKSINITPAAIGAAAASHGTHVTYSTTAPVMDGAASVGSAATVARSDHKHPTDTSRAAVSDLTSHTGNTTIHITAAERTNWNAAKTHADSAHAPSNAEKNQNAFSNVVVGSTTISADTVTDSLTLVGSNVTLTPDATNDKVTIGITKENVTTALGYTPPTQDTTYGSMSSSEGITGTATTNRVLTAANLKAIINGSAAAKLTTARTISLTGAVTGSGSFDGSGNLSIATTTNHSHSYLPLSGGTMTGQIKTSFKSSVAMGSYCSSATTVDALVEEIRYSSGAVGSVSIDTAYTAGTGGTIAAGWYNFFYSPHRTGGDNGAVSGDNCNYGTLILSGMTAYLGLWVIRVTSGAIAQSRRIWTAGDSVTGAVWNDYAECRESDCEDFGYVLMEVGNDSLTKTTERLSHFAGVSSDTWGFSQGETDKAKTPIAVAGRVLVYPYQNRNNYKPGDCVCAAPGGTVDIMTREEVREWPDRIVGTVSCVPDYEEWGGGEGADRDPVKVNGRIWIKVK